MASVTCARSSRPNPAAVRQDVRSISGCSGPDSRKGDISQTDLVPSQCGEKLTDSERGRSEELLDVRPDLDEVFANFDKDSGSRVHYPGSAFWNNANLPQCFSTSI
jgi:hypothetical protein